jgi:hypothetical protein
VQPHHAVAGVELGVHRLAVHVAGDLARREAEDVGQPGVRACRISTHQDRYPSAHRVLDLLHLVEHLHQLWRGRDVIGEVDQRCHHPAAHRPEPVDVGVGVGVGVERPYVVRKHAPGLDDRREGRKRAI